MSVCDPSLNQPLPATAKPIGSKLTPAMVQACQSRTNLPQNTFEQTTIDGVRVWLVSNCHTYTVINGQQVPGLFKGCSVWLDTSPVTGGPMVGESTDWGVVAVSAGALAATVYAFFWALKKADRRPRLVRA